MKSRDLEISSVMGKRIQSLRQQQGKSINDLAALTGLARSSLQNYEAGNRQPSLGIIKSLSKALGCNPAWLSGLVDSDSGKEELNYMIINSPYPGTAPSDLDSVSFNNAHLRKQGISPAHVRFLRAKDSLVAPDIKEGDEVLIDTSITKVERTDVYAVQDDSGSVVFRWARREFGKAGYVLYSNNDSHFPPIFVEDANESVKIIGRAACVVSWR
ncbi:LexA family transcriptional regulator [Pantoea sp. YU22]|uniref:XRE family transcriptional regulator n=1 Tax=Pantoea sp. YU22 TaxID=2497684 RepID=UPI000F888C86|nr:LexA family transcriptional regulator [Pantoea sp. YU22]RTY53671.1 LexA family transcriptional regulator [Pantoea sp. YU22]